MAIAFDDAPLTGRNTGLSIVFPSDVDNSIANGKLVHRWVDGRKVSEKNIQIRANGQLVGLISELLPAESLTFSPFGIVGSLEITFDKDVFIAAIEFFLAYQNFSKAGLVRILLVLAIGSAALGLMYFMHLAHEKRSLFLSLIPATIFVLLMLNMIWSDSIRLLHMRPFAH